MLLTKDDSALKVAEQVTFRGLAANKPVAYIYKKVHCDREQMFCTFNIYGKTLASNWNSHQELEILENTCEGEERVRLEKEEEGKKKEKLVS